MKQWLINIILIIAISITYVVASEPGQMVTYPNHVRVEDTNLTKFMEDEERDLSLYLRLKPLSIGESVSVDNVKLVITDISGVKATAKILLGNIESGDSGKKVKNFLHSTVGYVSGFNNDREVVIVRQIK